MALGHASITPLFEDYAVSNMVAIGSPITAYPADFNCTGIETGLDQQTPCPPVFPNVTQHPNCTYEKFESGFPPPGYVKGVCACGERPNRYACIIEECEGAEKYKKAYSQYLASIITGGVVEGLAVIGGISGLLWEERNR